MRGQGSLGAGGLATANMVQIIERSTAADCTVNAEVALSPPQAFNGVKLALQMQQQYAQWIERPEDVLHLIHESCSLAYSFGFDHDLR